MVTNKTDIIRFQWFAHHRRIRQSPGHRAILRNFYWVVTYRTAPAGVFICKHRLMPGQAPYDVVIRDQPDTVQCPADFIRIFTSNDEYIYISISKFAIIPPKKQVDKIRKIEANSDSDGAENHTCPRLQKNSIALVRCMFISCLIEMYIFCIMFLVLKWNIYVNTICSSAKTFCFSPVAVRLIKHRPVPGWASSFARTSIDRFVKRFSIVPGDCKTSYDARPGTVRCPDGHRWNCTI